jgi:hypothetical protein
VKAGMQAGWAIKEISVFDGQNNYLSYHDERINRWELP